MVRVGVRAGATTFASAAVMAGLAMALPAVATAETGDSDSAATSAASDQTGPRDRGAVKDRRRGSDASNPPAAAGTTTTGVRTSSKVGNGRAASGSTADHFAPEPSASAPGDSLTIEADAAKPAVSPPVDTAAPITVAPPAAPAASTAAVSAPAVTTTLPAAADAPQAVAAPAPTMAALTAPTGSAGAASATSPLGLPTGPVGGVLQLAAAQLLDPKRSRLPATPTASAVGAWSPGDVISLFISNGTAERPNAGLLVGNGFS